MFTIEFPRDGDVVVNHKLTPIVRYVEDNNDRLALGKVCHSITRMKAVIYGEETASKCYEIHPASDFEGALRDVMDKLGSPIELTVRANYSLSITVFDREEKDMQQASARFSYQTSPKCSEKIKNRYNPIITQTYNGDSQTAMLSMSPLCEDEYGGTFGEGLTELPTLCTHSAFRGSFGVDFSSMEFGRK